MSRAAKPGQTYWALVSTSGHENDNRWVTVLGSHWGVTLDPGEHQTYGRVYTTRAQAAAWQESLPDGTAGKSLEIAQVDCCGATHFKRHATGAEPSTDERVDPPQRDPRRDGPPAGGRDSYGRCPGR